MLKSDVLERQRPQIRQRNRIGRPRLGRHRENRLIDVHRRFRLAIDVDDIAQLLQRPEDEERVDEQREELSDRDGARVNQVQHQEHDAGAQQVDAGALNEAEAAQVLHLLQLEAEDLRGGAVQPGDFLRPQAEALHQLDVAQRFGGRSGQRSRFGDDDLLNLLDSAAEHRAEDAEDRHGQEVRGRDQPMDADRVGHDEEDADQRREKNIDAGRDQLLDVGAHLLQASERFAAALILEHRVGQLE